MTAVVSASTEADPGTFRTSSAEQQETEPELARTVTDALFVTTAQNVTHTTIVERGLFFPVSKDNTGKTKFSTQHCSETSLDTTTESSPTVPPIPEIDIEPEH